MHKAHDLLIRSSITIILLILNNTQIRWVSMHHNTVETSTYSSELVATRIAIELIIEVRFRSLVVDLDEPTWLCRILSLPLH
jgi:hypothetical protein